MQMQIDEDDKFDSEFELVRFFNSNTFAGRWNTTCAELFMRYLPDDVRQLIAECQEWHILSAEISVPGEILWIVKTIAANDQLSVRGIIAEMEAGWSLPSDKDREAVA